MDIDIYRDTCVAVYFGIYLKIITVLDCITIQKYSLHLLPGASLQMIILPASLPTNLTM